MKITSYLLVIFLTGAFQCQSQQDTSALLSAVNSKLSTGTTVSAILTDKTFLVIHPETRFREMIRDHAATGMVSIATSDEPGTKIKVICQLTNENGGPVANALVYLYQTDAKGWYSADAPHVQAYEGDTRHARLFGYVKTDANGKLVLETVKPSGYPKSDLPAHIHVHVSADGYKDHVTEFLFDDDPRLIGNIRQQATQNKFLVSKPEATPAPFSQLFSYSIRLLKKP